MISPFGDQSALISRLLTASGVDTTGVTVGTVHSFQGSERDVILFSPVLADHENPRMRFVDDPPLVNVAVTRARSLFVVIGDRSVFRNQPNLGALIEHIEALPVDQPTSADH